MLDLAEAFSQTKKVDPYERDFSYSSDPREHHKKQQQAYTRPITTPPQQIVVPPIQQMVQANNNGSQESCNLLLFISFGIFVLFGIDCLVKIAKS